MDPSWIPIVLANDPASFPVAVLDGVPSLVLPGADACAAGAEAPPAGLCRDGALVVPLGGPITAQEFALLTSLGLVGEVPPDLLPPSAQSSGYRRECWYHDTNHYSCCYYYDSGMTYCYDYYYECRRSGYYNRYCGWSAHQKSHTCVAANAS
ncbi:MAG TPA: hypothetical protein VHH36_07330 [Candidatus Thermoplasmatota archaeon]|nr:hypothetical protein [Candidatus Thermoplasmatota archaeon]